MPPKQKAQPKYTKQNKNCNSRIFKYKKHIKAGNSIINTIDRVYTVRRNIRHIIFIICFFLLIGLIIYSFLKK